MEELTNEIDRYLSQEMSLSESADFKKRLESDSALRKEVDLQRKTFRLLESAAWVETKNKVAQLNKKSSKTIVMSTWMKVAAVLTIGLLTSYILVHRSYSDQNLYASYHAPYPDRVTTMGADSDRRLQYAMESYNKKQYAFAQKQFANLRVTRPVNEHLIIIYEAVCFNQLGKHEDAIRLIENVKQEVINNSAIEWELILSYLAAGKEDKTRNLLIDFIKNGEAYKKTEAQKLLNDLNSFWR